MKKVIIIALLIVLSVSGCLDDPTEDQKIPRAKTEDLELTLEMHGEEFALNASSINITITLTNIQTHSVEIPYVFTLAANVFLNITTPDGAKLKYSDLFVSPLQEYEELAPKDSIVITIDLKNITWKINNQNYDWTNFDWTTTGTYTITGLYGGVSSSVYSNTVEFKIMA